MTSACRSRSTPGRHFAWLLWLALLLPLAQAAAACHSVSHAIDRAERDAQATQAVPCDICLVAVAVNTGALPGASTLLLQPPLRHSQATAVRPEPWLPSLALAYSSRAPPTTVH